ncbi:DUF6037 family protein [Cryobacterium sp. LW097]|uniref:DUF6037 family protein n=1 Tax=Cryobacterium sp. LW097 TaxID=1978566 RepID=UPI0012446745|nr:DUF6037 family protein [Cryobacterium sp. LW097]
MDGLRNLYRQMRAESQERAFFRFDKGKARLEVVFLIDESPFVLLISVHGHGGLTFEVPVLPGFRVSTVMEKQQYAALCRALGLEWDPSKPFSPAAFFRELDGKVPSGIPVVVPRSDVVGRRRMDVEESTKTYFIGWRKNIPTEHVSVRNLEKTLRLMGAVAHRRSRDGNFSSCWTDDSSRRGHDVLPPGQ